ncbi:MAG TPA: hypothetical protein VFS13_00665 [Steroidobacteraceae bacterium]|nr:hypothetical protein [Steroidobacteraceae bacterium]
MAMKFVFTGFLFVLFGIFAIGGVGNWPGPIIGVPILAMTVIGAAMVFCGILAEIWL